MIKRVLRLYELPIYIIFRPISGFYEMKYEGRGTLKLALFNFLMVCISFAFQNQYASVLVDDRHPLNMNSLWDFITICFAMLLFCTSNWAITSLIDGEGKFKEIIMTICYAMTPLVLMLIPATILSNFLTLDETAFYTMIVVLAVGWFIFLSFIGLLRIHNYTVFKAIIMVALTFVSLLIIVFLITLLLTLLQQLMVFVGSLYNELSFRI